MPNYLFAAPILPGKTESWKKYAQEIKGPRQMEYAASRQKAGLNTEQVWLQHTPNGDICVVNIEINDPNRLFQYYGESNEPFDKWFREKILTESHGLDFSKPAPLNEKIFGYQDEPAGQNNYGFVLPIPPGKTETLKNNLREMKESYYEELHRRNQKIGLRAVQVWLQKTPNGDFAVVRYDTDDPKGSFDYFMSSQEPFDNWFREKILYESFGMTSDTPPPTINELYLNYTGKKTTEKAYSGSKKA